MSSGQGAPPTPGACYRVDELAGHTGISVRNIREYQDRGILPPPQRVGRVAYYDDTHVVRLRLVERLLQRGYTLAVIRDLLEAWAAGRALEDVLGFETVVSSPWTDEAPARVSLTTLRRMFGRQLTPPLIRRVMRLGLLRPRGMREFETPSPSLLDAGVDLVAAGVPLRTVVEVIEQVQSELDAPADRLVDMVFQAVLPHGAQAGLPEGDELRQVTETIAVLRPHALRAVDALFATSLRRAIDRRFAVLTGAQRDSSARQVRSSTATTPTSAPDAQ